MDKQIFGGCQAATDQTTIYWKSAVAEIVLAHAERNVDQSWRLRQRERLPS